MKLTVTQSQYVMKRLKRFSLDIIQQLDPQVKDMFVPKKLATRDLKKYLMKLAYDNPKELVRLIIKGDEWTPLVENREARDAGFDQYHACMENLRLVADDTLLRMEADLMFKDDWDSSEYPEFLEDELKEEILSVFTYEESPED